MSRAKLTDQVIGHLTVLHYAGRMKWRCRCRCGQEILVGTLALKNEKVTSCGCQTLLVHKSIPASPIRFKEFKAEVGMTLEDQQWMQHYRTRYLERYRRSGQTPPIRLFY